MVPVTPAMGTAMMGPMFTLQGNGSQHGGHGFHLRLSTFQHIILIPLVCGLVSHIHLTVDQSTVTVDEGFDSSK